MKMYLRAKYPKNCEDLHPGLGAVFHPQHRNLMPLFTSVKNIE